MGQEVRGGYVQDGVVHREVWSLKCKTLLVSGNMAQSREPRGMRAPAATRAVLIKI